MSNGDHVAQTALEVADDIVEMVAEICKAGITPDTRNLATMKIANTLMQFENADSFPRHGKP